jgi:phage terminase large subunit
MTMEELFEYIRSDIYQYCEVVGFEPHFQQRQLLDAVAEGHPYICCKSGQGPGKTCATGHVVAWRTLRHIDSQAYVTAPTMRQCQNWLKELRGNMEKGDPRLWKLFDWTSQRAGIANRPNWEIVTATASDPKKLQGFHNEHMTYLLEEASGIDRNIVEQIEGTISNADRLLLQIGNPNDRDSDFFDAFTKNRRLYHCMTWDAEETSERRPDIVNPERNLLLEAKYGRESDAYRVRVKGEFPRADADAIFAIEDLEKCLKVDRRRAAKMGKNKSFGIDYARMGSDDSVIAQRMGRAIITLDHFSHVEPSKVTAAAFVMQHKWGWTDDETQYIPDAGGMGQGLMSTFYNAGKRIFEFHNGGKAQESDVYDNRISEAWFYLKALVETHTVHLPDDNRLLMQLSTRKYVIDEKTGKIRLEKKDKVKERTGESPDLADAVAMAFYDYACMPSRAARKAEHKAKLGESVT